MCEKVPNSDFDFSTFGQLFGIISPCAAVLYAPGSWRVKSLVYLKCQLWQLSRPVFTLCFLERGVKVTTYDFGFMDDLITN
jgi:hypothetical protein